MIAMGKTHGSFLKVRKEMRKTFKIFVQVTVNWISILVHLDYYYKILYIGQFINNENLFLTVLETGEYKIKLPEDSVLCPGSQMIPSLCVYSWCLALFIDDSFFLCIPMEEARQFSGPSYKGINLTLHAPLSRPKALTSTSNIITLLIQFQHMSLRDTNIQILAVSSQMHRT